ncbi:MAG: ABC transporter ATP-binding protein [Candidatus Liptonbacteria bacterium]|nr:ABC transporter ATP-binding protein [Candidatus Liptonbacteria bacterium]
MISVSNLEKVYPDEGEGTRALDNVSFAIAAGEFVSIMGPSGSGKSTLLHILSFLDRPTGGTYRFAGKSINDLSDTELARVRNQEMGFVFQSFNLLARSSVFENVALPLIYAPESAHSTRGSRPNGADSREQAVTRAVKAVGLLDKLWTEAGKLSGGQRQRVAIARALINDPNVIFADEPTGNLDSTSGAQVMDLLRELHVKGRTIVLVTHETYTAEYGQRLIELHDGRVVHDKPIARHHHKGEPLK